MPKIKEKHKFSLALLYQLHNSVGLYADSGVDGFEVRGVRAFVTSGCLALPHPHPHPQVRKNSRRIFTFCTDPTGQLRGGPDPWTPPASAPLYAEDYCGKKLESAKVGKYCYSFFYDIDQ